ncbi:MAG: hypothetical protein KDH92_03955 [Chloroflexi bacterium]|nr:hypothetical protein [Chloroflexota bacterium]
MPPSPGQPAFQVPRGSALADLIDAANVGGPRCIDGPVGAGKTEALVLRAAALIASGVPGSAILVLLPDREAVARFETRLTPWLDGSHAAPRCRTYYGLAQGAVRELWDDLAPSAGFSATAARTLPRLLTYETAQAMMYGIAAPRIAQGQFEGLSIRPQRLVSQLLDGLNRAATGGYPLDQVERRLAAAWPGEPARLRHYAQAAACMQAFRARCLDRGAVDVSLAVELFHHEVVERPDRRQALLGGVEHLLADNLEESVPVAQRLLGHLAGQARSTLLVRDTDAGHRIFLGADPLGAAELCAALGPSLKLSRRRDQDPTGAFAAWALLSLSRDPSAAVQDPASRAVEPTPSQRPDRDDALARTALRGAVEAPDRRAMIEAAADAVANELSGGLAAAQLAIVAPYVDGVLRFALDAALASRGIRLRTHRRHLPLRESPWVRAGLSLVALVEPELGLPEPFALAEALATALPAIDPVRSARLVRALYDRESGVLAAAEGLDARDRARIGPAAVEAYEGLRTWIGREGATGGEARPTFDPSDRPSGSTRLEQRLTALVAALASWRPPAAGEAAAFASLIEAAAEFRAAAPVLEQRPGAWAADFKRLVLQGLVSVRAPEPDDGDENAVLLAPAQTYLVEDQRHAVQLWLDAASPDWWSPPYQPLTNAWVLSPRWPEAQIWTRAIDREQRDQVLARLVAGLARRAETGIWVLACLGEAGELPLEGPLWRRVRDLAGDGLRSTADAREGGS